MKMFTLLLLTESSWSFISDGFSAWDPAAVFHFRGNSTSQTFLHLFYFGLFDIFYIAESQKVNTLELHYNTNKTQMQILFHSCILKESPTIFFFGGAIYDEYTHKESEGKDRPNILVYTEIAIVVINIHLSCRCGCNTHENQGFRV